MLVSQCAVNCKKEKQSNSKWTSKKAEENLITTCILGDSAKLCVRGWERQGRDTKKSTVLKMLKKKSKNMTKPLTVRKPNHSRDYFF